MSCEICTWPTDIENGCPDHPLCSVGRCRNYAHPESEDGECAKCQWETLCEEEKMESFSMERQALIAHWYKIKEAEAEWERLR